MSNNEYIEINNAFQNNLKHVNLKIKKHAITVFTGLSGAGKSSLVFDTIAASSRRELNETFPSFTQQYLPKYGVPHVESIKNLPVAIVIQQQKVGKNPRSTVSTYTGIYSLLRLLFSRIGRPWIGYSDCFSFNLPQGMCPKCQGLGYIDYLNPDKIIDYNKSLNEGAITFVSFGPGTWRWKRYAYTGLFDNDKKIKDYSKQELNDLLYAPQRHLKNAPDKWKKSILYEGVIPRIKRSILESREGQHHQKAIKQVVNRITCEQCNGTRLNDAALKCKINGKNIAEILDMDLKHVLKFIESIDDNFVQNLIRTLKIKIDSLIALGLGYLSLNRSTDTLSGGETQRIKIAKYMNSSLTDMVYILDEPSIGLHSLDINLVKNAIKRLKNQGNTVIIVEHNPELISIADYVVEIGPKPGKDGGTVTFNGSYKQLLNSQTLTEEYLKKPLSFKTGSKFKRYLTLENININNLKNVNISLPLQAQTVISGVAGSGKSSVVKAIKQHLKNENYIDLTQDAVGVNIRSTPATYLGILDDIRKLFAKESHVSRQLFSYNGKGKCPLCKGKGVQIINMAFMDPVVQVCEKCHGKRYSKEALQDHLNGLDISQVLSLSIKEAINFFSNYSYIEDKLVNMQKVGLDYLSLGQSLDTLSGGESQRLKLALQLNNTGTIYILDEPTAGLHMKDVEIIMGLFNSLVQAGNTLIIVEHNLSVISNSDWMIDIGPEAGRYGGQVIYEGTPVHSLSETQSKTGQAMKLYNIKRNE